MRKLTFGLLLVLLPTIAMAQATVEVASITGQVEWKPAASTKFGALQPATQVIQVGDQIRTGPGGQLVLKLPDTSWMVVSENSVLTIQDFWQPNLHNLVNLALGKVRFFIQRFGGKPNPYRVQTPTALIAVRGTTFEVTAYDANLTEVSCLEGSVQVESIGLPNREVILEPGRHTVVPRGAPPAIPVAANEPLLQNRVIAIVRMDKDQPTMNGKTDPMLERMIRDNDRRNRTVDPLQSPRSTTTTETQRAKPTLRYPDQH